MPRKYVSKFSLLRGQWTENYLKAAIVKIKKNQLSIKIYGSPSRTLRQRLQSGILKKIVLEKPPALRLENENRIVCYIKKLQTAGFASTVKVVKKTLIVLLKTDLN